MSLIRLAFWLALLVLLLPTDAAQQARFTAFANAALERLSSFCDRNAATCEMGQAAWATFLRKAEFGMRLVGDLIGLGGRQSPAPAQDDPAGEPPSGRGNPPGKRVGHLDTPEEAPSPAELYAPPWRQPRRADAP